MEVATGRMLAAAERGKAVAADGETLVSSVLDKACAVVVSAWVAETFLAASSVLVEEHSAVVAVETLRGRAVTGALVAWGVADLVAVAVEDVEDEQP